MPPGPPLGCATVFFVNGIPKKFDTSDYAASLPTYTREKYRRTTL